MIAQKKPIQEFIRDIAYQTFEITCYMFPVDEDELEDMGIDTSVDQDEMVTSMVTFQGAAEGAMLISASEDLYEALAANMLGVDSVDHEEKDAALCEIANIICGNIVPYFAKNGNICIINPPQISDKNDLELYNNEDYEHEQLRVFVDEGIAEISIFFK